MLLDVVHVEPLSEYKLSLEFENHEKRIFDVTPYLEMGVFRQLKDKSIFSRAFFDGGTVMWPGEIDIAPETLYDHSVLIS
jgi:hypothetical protein